MALLRLAGSLLKWKSVLAAKRNAFLGNQPMSTWRHVGRHIVAAILGLAPGVAIENWIHWTRECADGLAFQWRMWQADELSGIQVLPLTVAVVARAMPAFAVGGVVLRRHRLWQHKGLESQWVTTALMFLWWDLVNLHGELLGVHYLKPYGSGALQATSYAIGVPYLLEAASGLFALWIYTAGLRAAGRRVPMFRSMVTLYVEWWVAALGALLFWFIAAMTLELLAG